MIFLRNEKTTKNRDDFRVLITGVLVGILIILATPFVNKGIDRWFATRPFVSAIVKVYYIEGTTKPMIFYDADATQPVQGEWRATLHEVNGARLATRKGLGSYNNKKDDGKLWSWDGWFEDKDPTISAPDIPDHPFFVCVHYTVEARDSGELDESIKPFCSNIYDPENPLLPPEVFPQLGDT